MSSLEGKSIIVTGGASGIGLAAVEILAAAGALVTIADLSESGHEIVTTLGASERGRAQFVHTDVANEQSVQNMVAAAESAFGRVDGAINSAGVAQHWKRLHELSAEEWDSVCNVNLRGMFLCMKHQITSMLRTGGGAIVAVASIAATMGFGNSPEYCASKAGVTGLVRATALDYAKAGIRVNALLPGVTATPMVERSRQNKPQHLGSPSIPNGRMAQPAEPAHGAVWMLSDESSYMNGSCVTIDAGVSVT